VVVTFPLQRTRRGRAPHRSAATYPPALDRDAVAALIKDIEDTVQQDPIGSLRYSSYRIVSSSAEPSTA
jgi:hypothetical protein